MPTFVSTSWKTVQFFIGVLFVFLLLGTPKSYAVVPVISDITVTDITYNSATILWKTDIPSQGKVRYGKTPGNRDYTSPTTTTGTSHTFKLSSFQSENVYFTITAYNEGDETESTEQSFAMATPPDPTLKATVRFVNDKEAYIEVENNFSDIYGFVPENGIEYGRISGEYDSTVNGFSGSNGIKLDHLWAGTTYYFRYKIQDYSNPLRVFYSSEQTFATLAKAPEITQVSPSSGTYGDTVTMTGSGFGDIEGVILFGQTFLSRHCDDHATIVEWTDTRIRAKISEPPDDPFGQMGCASAQSGAVTFFTQGFYSYSGPVMIWMRTATGGSFTLEQDESATETPSESSPAEENNEEQVNANTSTEALKKSDIYGCGLSVTSNQSSYLEDVALAYRSTWDRDARCDELQFHLSHSTPMNRVQTFLNDNVVTEDYGCYISTTTSDANTVKVSRAFGRDSETDKYLSLVLREYTTRWQRQPRCDELQFHLDHATPIATLTKWLDQNKNTVLGELSIVPVLEMAKVDGDPVNLLSGELLTFSVSDDVTFSGTTSPNAIVILTFLSNPQVFITQSDASGSWAYILEKGTLESGSHTVTVAIADQNLEKTQESESIAFAVTQNNADEKSVKVIVWVGLIIVLVLGGYAGFVFGRSWRRRVKV